MTYEKINQKILKAAEAGRVENLVMSAPVLTPVKLKLLIDPKSNRLIFAEAGKDFVDFLFTILSLPVGTITRLLSKQQMVGCLGNLYDSIEYLGDTCIESTANKCTLLKPMVFNCAADASLMLLDTQSASSLYRCSVGYTSCYSYVANDPQSICPSCQSYMSQKVTFVNPNKTPASQGLGSVKGGVTYMITDDLVVRPLSTVSIITTLNKFNVKDVGVLEEKVIDIGMDEGLKLLRASMQSKVVLTDAFLVKKVE